jgi:cytochrome P450
MPLGAMREAMRLLREYNTSLFPIPLSCPVHRNRKLNGHRETLDRFIDSHIKSRRANGQPDKPDFLSVLMSAEDPDSGELLSRQALIDETKTLFIAGFETTAGVMAWALYLLASHPECAAISAISRRN